MKWSGEGWQKYSSIAVKASGRLVDGLAHKLCRERETRPTCSNISCLPVRCFHSFGQSQTTTSPTVFCLAALWPTQNCLTKLTNICCVHKTSKHNFQFVYVHKYYKVQGEMPEFSECHRLNSLHRCVIFPCVQTETGCIQQILDANYWNSPICFEHWQ